MKAEITFKSGAQILVDVTEFSTEKHRATREITAMSWTTPESWTRKLHTLALSEIVAIVAVADEPEPNGGEES